MPVPILPTRVFPAGEPLPAPPATAPSAPPVPPPPPARPPTAKMWPPPPPPEPAPLVVHVHVLLPEVIAPEPEPTWSWDRIKNALQIRRNLIGCAVALFPFGYWSFTTAWGTVLRQARTPTDIRSAWYLAALVIAVTVTADHWRPRWYSRAMTCTAVLGTAYMAAPYDIVTLVTGVHS